ncbi:HNH endonuclease-domain-containing protein [Tricladium varicosporioides]|nr:HNH endonuclease-domain-containing protein [Hymenoscyphus varicosporioides]
MSSFSSTSSSCSHSSHSDPDTLEDVPKDIVPQPKNTLPQHDEITPRSENALPHLADTLSQPKDSTTSGSDRSRHRNVHIFNASDRSTTIGGLILTKENNVTNCVTNANFYAMVEIIVIVKSNFTLRNESDITIAKDNSPLQPGNYFIHAPQPLQLNNELILCRALSLQTGNRVQAFRDAIRSRDRRCVITGEEYLDDDNWRGFEAAHIFPLAYEQYWIEHNYSRWISTPPNGQERKERKINSIQNGLLLNSAIHQMFDFYDLSINPDDNYKIVCFSRDRKGIAGKYLDQRLLDDPQRPAEELLRWHFRQAVLTNMKGAGEPQFEHDFPPGSDMVGSILEGPKAAKRMEFELFSRLATQLDLTQ